MDLATGQILRDRYRIVNKLAEGGFGAVYRAWDLNLRAHCAVKANLSTGEAVRDQFLREAKILSKLTHPHLPRVTDYFSVPGMGQYLVMDYIEGQDLQQMLDEKNEPLPQTKVMQWTFQVCDAIMYLHSQSPAIIHRDIKPANVKVTPDGRAVLVDFGIAKVFDAKSETVVGAKAVTPGFSPPEQYGRGATDIRSDVYALGATLYALLTGEVPPSSVDIISKIVPPPSPARMRNPAIPENISLAIANAMQMEKQTRFPSIADFRDALTEPDMAAATVGTVTVQPVHTPAPPAAAPPQKRSKGPCVIFAVIIGGILILGLLAGGIWLGTSGMLSDIFGGGATSTPVGVAIKNTPKSETVPGVTDEPTEIPPSPTFTMTPEDTATPTIEATPTLAERTTRANN